MNKNMMVRFAAGAGILLFVLFVGMQLMPATASETSLAWYNFNDGLAEAKKTNKKVLIDVYTDWCGWCKKMDSQTYANKLVADYLKRQYVIIKLNAESNKQVRYKNQTYTEREIAAAFGINGYPATLFLKPDGEPITIYPGFADAQRFKLVLSFIAEDHYLSKSFEEYATKN
jgi:thioredoxin-related protein